MIFTLDCDFHLISLKNFCRQQIKCKCKKIIYYSTICFRRVIVFGSHELVSTVTLFPYDFWLLFKKSSNRFPKYFMSHKEEEGGYKIKLYLVKIAVKPWKIKKKVSTDRQNRWTQTLALYTNIDGGGGRVSSRREPSSSSRAHVYVLRLHLRRLAFTTRYVYDGKHNRKKYIHTRSSRPFPEINRMYRQNKPKRTQTIRTLIEPHTFLPVREAKEACALSMPFKGTLKGLSEWFDTINTTYSNIFKKNLPCSGRQIIPAILCTCKNIMN